MIPPSFLHRLLSNRDRVVRGAWLLTLIVASVGCQPQSTASDILVAAGEDPLITRKAFQARLRQQMPDCEDGPSPACTALKRHLLNQMIEEALLLRRARQRGIEISNTLLKEAERELLQEYEGAEEVLRQLGHDRGAWRAAVKDRLMIEAVMEEIFHGVQVGRHEALSFFQTHRELFVQERQVRVRQIVVARAAEATDILSRLRKGENFARLAMEVSLSPEASEGGDMGFLRPGRMPPELAEAAFALDVGKTSEVIPSAYGFHVVRVEEQIPPRELEFSEVEEEIRRRLLGEKMQSSYVAWMRGQWAEAKVRILDSRLSPEMGEGDGT